MDQKKLHTWEFQQEGIGRNMRCKLLQKRPTGKTTGCSKRLQHISIEKDIFSKLNRCIFQISLNYIKLVIPKILVLCNFKLYFKTTWIPPPPRQFNSLCQNMPPSPAAKTFLKFLTPAPPKSEGGCMPWPMQWQQFTWNFIYMPNVIKLVLFIVLLFLPKI